MAYSKTPSLSTYETKRVSFVGNPENRGVGDKDLRLLNMMVDLVESPTGKRVFLKNRPGLAPYASSPAGEGRGLFLWYNYGHEIHVIGNKVYLDGVVVITLTTSSGNIGFAEHVDDSAQHTILMVDGIEGYVFKTDGTFKPCIPVAWTAATAYVSGDAVSPVTANGFCYDCTVSGTTAGVQPAWPTTVGATVVDGTVTWECREQAFPTPHAPYPVFLDGYMFLPKANTQDIQNCDLNYPLKWSAGNYITAEMYPDTVVALAKNNNLIYGIGQSSVQIFYDNANPTGTPLLNNPGVVIQFGCPAPMSVVQTDKEVIMVADTSAGGRSVWTIDGYKANEITIPAVAQALDNEGSLLTNAIATSIRVMGQKLYVLSLTNTTWVYSLTTEMWSQWSGVSGNFSAARSAPNDNGSLVWLGKTDGRLYTMSMSVYTDNGIPYPCTLTSTKFDFDTINRKTMSRMCLIGDVPSSTTANQVVYVTWSDDDYQTWSASRTMTLNGDLPSIRQLGDFRRRAFRISYASGLPFRIEGIEVDINKGSK